MKTYMTKYLVTYWVERNDEAVDLEKEIYAYNEIDAIRKFQLDTVYKKIERIEEIE